MRFNRPEAKTQLSRLVEAALQGEEVVIARDGEPMVRLVPVAREAGLTGRGSLRKLSRTGIDAAFTSEADAAVRRALDGSLIELAGAMPGLPIKGV